MARKAYKVGLRAKLMTLLLSMLVLSVVLTAYLTFLSSKHFFIQSTVRSLEGLAEAKSQTINNIVSDRIEQVEGIAAYPNIILGIEKIVAENSLTNAPVAEVEPVEHKAVVQDPNSASMLSDVSVAKPQDPNKGTAAETQGIFQEVERPKEQIEDKEALEKSVEYKELNKILALILGRGKKFEELFILDPAGTVVISTVYQNEGKSAENSEFFTTGLKTTFVQDIFVSEITQKLSMVIATPLKNEEGKTIGVMGARLNLDALYQSIRDETGLGTTGETIVGKRIEDDVVFMGPTRYDDKAALNRKVHIGAKLAYPLQEASRGGKGSGFYGDYRDVSVLAVWQFIPLLEWGLVVKVDSSEALEGIKHARNRIIGVTLALLLCVVVLSHYVSKQIVRPIQELTKAADSISKGDTDIEILVKSRDEVGDLADSFERMLASIKFLSEQEK